MGTLSDFGKRLGKTFVVLLLVTSLIMFLPWLPPHLNFEPLRTAPPMPLTGKLTPNTILDKATPLLDGEITGPESIAIRGDELYTGLIGGNVIRYKNGKATVIAKFGSDCEAKWEEPKCGRPCGMRFSPADGKLIVADAYHGIFSVDVDTGDFKNVVSTNTTIDGKRSMIINDLDVSRQGQIYFGVSSTHSIMKNSIDEFIGEPSGRLVRYDPKTTEFKVLLEGLHFANGVQLSKDEDFVLVSESAGFRIMKYHLKGEKEGTSEIFIDGLPGSPDNIRPNRRGGMCISLVAPRYADKPNILDLLGPLPYVRKFILRVIHIIKIVLNGITYAIPNDYTATAEYYVGNLQLFAGILPKHAIILEVDQDGNIIQSFHGLSKVHHISEISVDNKGKYAYLGSPYNTQIWKISTSHLRDT